MPTEDSLPNVADNARVTWIEIQGRPILHVNFNHATPAQSLIMLEELPRAFEAQDLNSVRALTDSSSVSYDPGVSSKWKAELVKFNPYLRACAVYGASGLASVATNAVIELVNLLSLPNSKMKVRSFKTKESAIEWLLNA